MSRKVRLDDGPLIEFLPLCRAIAEATYPADETDLKDIDCVTGKSFSLQLPIPNIPERSNRELPDDQAPALTSGDVGLQVLGGPNPASAEPISGLVDERAITSDASPGGNPFHLQCVLTQADRQILQALLPSLPPLRYPMSDDEAATFMDAYSRLEDRPIWTPILMMAGTMQQLKNVQHTAMLRHQHALQLEAEAGRVVAVSSDHVPVKRLSTLTFIPRAQVISYLDRCGLAWETKEDFPVQQQRADDSSAIGGADDERATSGALKKKTYTREQKKRAIDIYKRAKREGAKDFAEQAANSCGATTRAVQMWVAESEGRAPDKKSSLPVLYTFPGNRK